MAYDVLNLKNPKTTEIKAAPVGFSWTVLFFGPWPALFRQDWLWALIMFVPLFFTMGITNIIFAFIYNKVHIKNLIMDKGFKVTGCTSGNLERITADVGIELPTI
jgi:hypothetical protein